MKYFLIHLTDKRVFKLFAICLKILCIPNINNAFTHDLNNRFTFLPNVASSLNYSIIHSQEEFTGKQSKEADIIVFSYNNFQVSMYVHENIYTVSKNNSRFYPHRIAYYMDYVYISYRLHHSTIGITVNHICYNTFDKATRNVTNEMRWYGIGFLWQSIGMKTGYKNISMNNKDLLSLYNLHYSLYIGYPFVSKIPQYKSMSSIQLRYDFPLHNFAPYFQVSFDGLMYPNNSFSINRAIEVGNVIPFSSLNVLPYVSYNYMHNSPQPGRIDKMWCFGIKAESLISSYNNLLFPSQNQSTASLHTEIGYGKTISSNFYNFATDFSVGIRTRFLKHDYIFYNSKLTHFSESKSTALYPRFIYITLQPGYSKLLFADHFLNLYTNLHRRHDGNEYRGQREQYLSFGLSFHNAPPLSPYLITSPLLSSSKILSSAIEYELSIERILKKCNYPYEYLLLLKMYNYSYIGSNIYPYCGAKFKYFIYNKKKIHTNYEYELESGIAYRSNLPLRLYYTYRRTIDINIVGGAVECFHSIGIKLSF